ncbi:MAG: hypothetical protein J6Y03_03290 [Alphaproteobacteria bacterium]|nr:hypothetical protein [Alphaproteobacteria bacterium]
MSETLKHDKNTSEEQDLKEAVHSFEQSHVIIGQRVEKSEENPHGFKHVFSVPPDKPAVLFFGGTGTEVDKGSDKSANGYLSHLETYLKKSGIEKILKEQTNTTDIKKALGLYSIIYDFGKTIDGGISCEKDLARGTLFAKHKQIWSPVRFKIINNKIYRFLFDDEREFREMQNKEYAKSGSSFRYSLVADVEDINPETLKPNYIDELFNNVFLSRICDENGKKLPIEEACKRVRNVTVCAHCHGAYTFLKIEEKMQQKMMEVGYSNEERAKIQSQLLCVALSPDAPLGVSKSTMISFISSFDIRLIGIYNYNNFKEEIKEMTRVRKEKIEPSYFPGKKGEFFLIHKIYDSSDWLDGADGEHNLLNSSQSEPMSEDGKILFEFAANAITNGIKSSLEKTPLPSIEELVCGQSEKDKSLFQTFKKNGEELWAKMKKNITASLSARYKQKTY